MPVSDQHEDIIVLKPLISPGGSQRRKACRLEQCPLSAAGSPLEQSRVR